MGNRSMNEPTLRDEVSALNLIIDKRDRAIKGLSLVLAEMGVSATDAWARAEELLAVEHRQPTSPA
jgi:hypothetical protein